MRSRHHPKRMRGGSCEQRARGGGVTHHPHSEPVKVIAGEGAKAKLHAARRARGGTCWYCGEHFGKGHHHKHGGRVKHRDDGGGVSKPERLSDPGADTSPMAVEEKGRALPMSQKQAAASSQMNEQAQGRKSGGGKWIQGAIKHPGGLHRALHVPQGQKIPAAKMAKASHSENPRIRRMVGLAKTLKKMHH